MMGLFFVGVAVWLIGTGLLFTVGSSAFRNNAPVAAFFLWSAGIVSGATFVLMMGKL
jgi:hypothetical protein